MGIEDERPLLLIDGIPALFLFSNIKIIISNCSASGASPNLQLDLEFVFLCSQLFTNVSITQFCGNC